jgi:SRSO17 transposase
MADAGYGDVGDFRDGLTARGLQYVLGEASTVMVWPPGSKGRQTFRFAAMRVRVATEHRRNRLAGDLQWLRCAWPKGEVGPTKFWLSKLPIKTTLKDFLRAAKLRWRVERDYRELKQELGLDHFEGRAWRGFHYHASLCAIAHGFLALRRALFPPEPGAVDASNGQAHAPAGSATPRWRLPSVPKANR